MRWTLAVVALAGCASPVSFDPSGEYVVDVEHRGDSLEGHAVTLSADGLGLSLEWPSHPCAFQYTLSADDGETLTYAHVPTECEYLGGADHSPRTLETIDGLVVVERAGAIDATIVVRAIGPSSSRDSTTLFQGVRR